ncbi:hypothetical protein BDM02DRAFT_2475830 [Thelephora ganbajun]|uniref:Uncharacterized protein n=1 Tax=Thelephora ganbajun TaxID=370292 RepID=A0ACB6ZER5_THEGA|nr:hypothetical protein BDM02DRAFT_2475830 [Thelephora ganbajun]
MTLRSREIVAQVHSPWIRRARGTTVRGRQWEPYTERSRSSSISLLPDIAMSTSVGGRELYTGRSPSVSQLLDAAKRNLQSSTFGRVVTTMSQSEVR